MSKAGEKLYEFNEQGDLSFKPGRRAWGVDIPAYAYDIWMPLIGLRAIGIYGLIWRLAREGKTRDVGVRKLALRARMGCKALTDDLALLERCGFIKTATGDNYNSNTYTVLDIPMVIPAALLNDPELLPPDGYQPLCPWHMEGQGVSPNGDTLSPNGDTLSPNGDSIIEPSVEPSVEPSLTGRAATSGETSTTRRKTIHDLPANMLFGDEEDQHESKKAKPLTRHDDVNNHELVLLLSELTGVQRLNKDMLRVLVGPHRIPTEDGITLIPNGLIGLWDKTPGFANFCRQRIPELLAMDGVDMQPLAILQHLRKLNKVKDTPHSKEGFWLWREDNESLWRDIPGNEAPQTPALTQEQHDYLSAQLDREWDD